ncbi:NADH-ubiquinone oxidoreductase [Teratosphaeria destructans]|uniref:NADH-ubiquinone oxidoreductase n=1 Tax=Teratosphaeria destructans TaxID=418781 RepID=A0A9W7W6M4_9PEZI|nr:NADH-ubiquinone oxidoreductase [Teratosphaeria destructans]
MATETQPPAVKNVREDYPEMGVTSRRPVPARDLNQPYPLIDCDPHFKRVVSYARPSDYVHGGIFSTLIPGGMHFLERISPSESGRPIWLPLYYAPLLGPGREVEMDMREMTDKVKRGEPLYGVSTMTAYMQGVASRQSRYSGVFLHVMPWFNFVNHDQHGVDTAKYFRNAEKELEEERLRK